MAIPIYTNELEMDIIPAPKISITTWSSSLKQTNSNKIKEYEKYFEFNHSGRVTKAFMHMRLILLILGRSPFVPLVKKVGIKKDSTGTSETRTSYEPSMKSPYWIYFFFTSFIIALVLVLSTFGVADYFLQWDISTWTREEIQILKLNLVPFVLFWSCLIHTTVGNVSFVFNRGKITKYMNNWNVVVDIIDIQVPKSVPKYLLVTNLWFLAFLVLIFFFYIYKLVPIVRGGSALIGILTFRPFLGEIDLENFWKIRVFGLCILLYAIYSSRVLLMVFFFMTRLLRYCFKVWNERLHEELETSRFDKRNGSTLEKLSCEKLYRDHCLLSQLVKQTDKVFGAVLQSYYASQILNLCFELYYLARSGTKGSFGIEAESRLDILAAVVLLLQNVYFFMTVSLDAAYVGEEAMRGFDVIRLRGLNPDDSVHKKYLLYSLHVSYSQRIVITGGKFFSLDRPFIVTVLGAVFTYFVIILQFGPTLNDSTGSTPILANV